MTSSTQPIWDQTLQPLRDALSAGGRAALTAAHASALGFALTWLGRAPLGGGPSLKDRSWLVLTDSDESAERLYDDLAFFYGLFGMSSEPLALFPQWETLPYEPTAPHPDLVARRMRALHRLIEGERTVLVASVP